MLFQLRKDFLEQVAGAIVTKVHLVPRTLCFWIFGIGITGLKLHPDRSVFDRRVHNCVVDGGIDSGVCSTHLFEDVLGGVLDKQVVIDNVVVRMSLCRDVKAVRDFFGQRGSTQS